MRCHMPCNTRSLLADCAFTGRELNPLACDERFLAHRFLLSRASPGAIKQRPETATRQLDYVFASQGLAKSLRVQALNAVEEWGPSDHCRIQIELAEDV